MGAEITSKHTPKHEWVVVEAYTNRPEYDCYLIYESGERRSEIVELNFPTIDVSKSTNTKYARWMAAAPQLLRACQKALEHSAIRGVIRDRLEAALAKADVNERPR